MNEALRQCAERGISFEETFRYQYVIARTPLDVPMAHQTFGQCHVYTGKDAQVARLRDVSGADIGLLIGIAVDAYGLIEGDWTLWRVDLRADNPLHQFEDWLTEVAGRYTILLSVGDEERVYCDPVGMNGVTYHRGTARVAASPLLCLDRPLIDHPLYDHRINEQEGGKYSLFHTRDAEVRRMNASFYLDLDNFTEVRFWPRRETFDIPLGAHDEAYDEIIATAAHNIGAIAARHVCSMPVTGGHDSRLLIALANEHRSKIAGFHSHVTNYATRRDAMIGQVICDTLGLPHETHDGEQTPMLSRTDRRKWIRQLQVATGTRMALPKEYAAGVVEALPEGRVVLRGHQTDFLRAVFVRTADKAQWKNLRAQIRRLLIMPGALFDDAAYERFLPDYLAWQRTLPQAALTKQPDFMFLEVYYNSSLGSLFPGLSRNFYMSPFNSRRLITLSMSFDDAYRIDGKPVEDIVHRLSPEVNAIPFAKDMTSGLDTLDDPEQRAAVTRDRVEAVIARAAHTGPRKQTRVRA